VQLPCALWRGLDELRRALTAALDGVAPVRRHAVTMTGELTDLFPDRAAGVAAILDVVAEFLPAAAVAVYTTEGAFISAERARASPGLVASANWHATSRYLAASTRDGLLLDIGSTTTDIVPFAGGRVTARGATDVERLATGELVYTGVVRTPLAVIAPEVPFGGRRVGVMAEYFATAADAHRLAGTLPEGADLHTTADNRGKSLPESRARLARMIGMDAGAASESAWRALAEAFIRRQTAAIEIALERVLSGSDLGAEAPVIGAGTGRFLAPEIARRFGRPHRDFGDSIMAASPAVRSLASDIAPAVAVALLLSREGAA
jgi:probable H4MPT-linked C1 transfer pathway protein